MPLQSSLAGRARAPAAVASRSQSPIPATGLLDQLAVPMREGQFSPPKPGWKMQPRLHVADSASAQHLAAKEVFEVATDMENTSLRRQHCFVHAHKIWMNCSSHKALVRTEENLETMKQTLSWVNNSVFSADVAVVAIDLMLDRWRNDLGEGAFAEAWAAAWRGKRILLCQALDGFPGGLPASNNMLEVRTAPDCSLPCMRDCFACLCDSDLVLCGRPKTESSSARCSGSGQHWCLC